MPDLFLSTEFWFGAAVLGAYQFAKFSELSSLDPDFAARSALIPNLRAIDFAGKPTYCATLAAFLAATFLIYFVLCNISPTILLGWAQVSGALAERGSEKVRQLRQLPSLHRGRITSALRSRAFPCSPISGTCSGTCSMPGWGSPAGS